MLQLNCPTNVALPRQCPCSPPPSRGMAPPLHLACIGRHIWVAVHVHTYVLTDDSVGGGPIGRQNRSDVRSSFNSTRYIVLGALKHFTFPRTIWKKCWIQKNKRDLYNYIFWLILRTILGWINVVEKRQNNMLFRYIGYSIVCDVNFGVLGYFKFLIQCSPQRSDASSWADTVCLC